MNNRWKEKCIIFSDDRQGAVIIEEGTTTSSGLIETTPSYRGYRKDENGQKKIVSPDVYKISLSWNIIRRPTYESEPVQIEYV